MLRALGAITDRTAPISQITECYTRTMDSHEGGKIIESLHRLLIPHKRAHKRSWGGLDRRGNVRSIGNYM
ncbi:uncharacterized protein LAJ45_02464 [Morchella importuna]|uniref:uncharacterized protein n=1 Tax=Morchella importuna TaxID=1174673 RepID=UPI001E8E8903|nr:uncharacterized protein LAJ45_02464 [Morchella importuna]KAH8153651.1 hypothetical protein LAJ45_02464 [Morchella importuna]